MATQAFDPQQRPLVVRVNVLRRERRLERATDDHGEEVGVGDVRDGGGAAELAVAQDRDAVGDLTHLGQPVGDVDDRSPLRRELPDRGEEQLHRVLRQRGRRLVEDQESRRHGERLGDLEQVPPSDAERGDAVFEMAKEMDAVEQRAHRPCRILVATPQMLGCDGHADVLGDRHVWEKRRMLVDDRDP